MNPWFAQEFNKRVEESLNTRTDKILSGNLSPEEYNKLVNYRLGLLAALEIFREIEVQMENE
jgi:hypothetical protein